MAKHSKGKHSASKKPFEWKAKRSASKSDEKSTDDFVDLNADAVSDGFSSDEESGSDLVADNVKSKSNDADVTQPIIIDTEKPKPASSDAGVTQPILFESDKPEPKAHQEHKADTPSHSHEAPAISIKPERDRKKIAKRLGISFGVLVALLVILYFVGVLAFHSLLMPNSKVSSIDMSFKTKDQVSADLSEAIGKYNFKVKGHGMNVMITSSEAGIALDTDEVATKIIESQDPWTWPLTILQEHDVSQAVAEAMSATGLSEVIKTEVERVNATAKAPVDATVSFVEKSKAFEVIPEEGGTMLDFEKVLEATIAGTLILEDDIILTRDALLQPNVFQDDKRLSKAALEANRICKANVKLNLDGTEIAVVDASVIWPWVEISPEFDVVFNADKMNEWTKDIASKCNTVGSTRTYTRPDGKVVTVSGGTYGWRIDSDSLVQSVTDAINNGTIGVIDIPVQQSGSGFTTLGGQDWGKRYVDVDISEQRARFYDDSGNIIWESAIVSGLPTASRATPKGVYSLNQKASPSTLIGYKPDGSKDYETKVQYWMPFKGNSVGFHDASWQPSFGGNRYTYGGSHGCVNLPPAKAKELYGIIKTGDVVVVHS